jgi:hypothetical protein
MLYPSRYNSQTAPIAEKGTAIRTIKVFVTDRVLA